MSTPKRKRSGRPVGETLGGIIVGFDQQILRTLPPPQELVQKGAPVRGVSGEDGSEFVVVFPGDGPEAPDPPEPALDEPEPAPGTSEAERA